MADNDDDHKHENEKNDYEVGYGKPPKASRFQKGQVGNSKGRPKGSKNLKTIVQKALNAPLRIKVNGKSKIVTTQEAIVTTVVEQALKKNQGSIKMVLEYGRLYNNDETAAEASALSNDDEALVNGWLERLSTEVLEEGEAEEDDGSESP